MGNEQVLGYSEQVCDHIDQVLRMKSMVDSLLQALRPALSGNYCQKRAGYEAKRLMTMLFAAMIIAVFITACKMI